MYWCILTHFQLTLHFLSGTITATLTSLLPTLVRRFAGSILPIQSLLDCQIPLPWWLHPICQKLLHPPGRNRCYHSCQCQDLQVVTGHLAPACITQHSSKSCKAGIRSKNHVCTSTYQVHDRKTRVHTSKYSVQLCPRLQRHSDVAVLQLSLLPCMS
jgi:hypothetical protein